MFHDRTVNAARGKWRGILMELGVPAASLTGKHGPCPLCTSRDNFRFDNKEGSGSSICTCGARTGMRLAMEFTGKEFREVAYEIDKIVGNLKPGSDDPVRPEMSDDDRRRLLRATYMETKRMEMGDLADKYLETRGVNEPTYPDTLRFSASMKDGQGGTRPAMVALVGVYGEDRYCSMHRTFLRPDGLGKAEMESPRKLMPGALPDGACVALSDYVAGSPLGIAEGIETALAAARLYEMPVWAALNANMLAKWFPPDGCREVAVFGDNDPKFAGQEAAFSLAHKLAVKGIEVTVHIPEVAGMDWNDVLIGRGN